MSGVFHMFVRSVSGTCEVCANEEDNYRHHSVTRPCNVRLTLHSIIDHDFLRTLMPEGQCPICDPSVTREVYAELLGRITASQELRVRVLKP